MIAAACKSSTRAPAVIKSAEVSFPNESFTASAMLFKSDAREPLPGVIVGHGNPGFPQYLSDFCGALASHGLAVLLVDWTKRFPPYPTVESEVPAWRKQVGGATLWRAAASDLGAGVAWMKKEGHAKDAGAAAIGFCGGGDVLAQYAAERPPLSTLILLYANARISRDFNNPDDPLPDLIELADRF